MKPTNKIGHGHEVDDVQEPVERPDYPDDSRHRRRVLQRHTDEHENEEADSDDIGHDPVADEGGLFGRVHEALNVASARLPR